MADPRRKRNRLIVDEIKRDAVCLRCQESDEALLTFHHRIPKEKSFNISDAAQLKVSVKRLADEIKKCDILCRDCHDLEHEPRLIDLPHPLKAEDFEVVTKGGLTLNGFCVILRHVKVKGLSGRGTHLESRRVAHDRAVSSLLCAILERWGLRINENV